MTQSVVLNFRNYGRTFYIFHLTITQRNFKMPLDYSEMTLEEILRTYSSIKGHSTCCEMEITNLLALLNMQYSSTSETHINDRLECLEKHTHKLCDLTYFFLTTKYTKAKDHQDEVAEFLAEDIFTVLHNRHAATQAVANPAQPVPMLSLIHI